MQRARTKSAKHNGKRPNLRLATGKIWLTIYQRLGADSPAVPIFALLALTIGVCLITRFSRVYALDAFSTGVPSGFDLISFGSSVCPPGYTEDTAAQGFYLLGRAAAGTVGNSVGSAIAGATPPDSSYTPAGTNNACLTQNAVSTGGTINVCSPAFSPVFSGTANATMRSTVAPAKYVLICKKT
jgi:hypothetical protein